MTGRLTNWVSKLEQSKGKGTYCLLCVVAVISMLVSVPAIAANSETLISSCRYFRDGASPQDTRKGSTCFLYLKGFYDGYTTGRLYIKTKPSLAPNLEVCFPEGVTWTQLAAVYVNWADSHPGEWHQEEWATLRSAWASAFPCRQ